MKLRNLKEKVIYFAVRELALMIGGHKRYTQCYGVDVWQSAIAMHVVILIRAIFTSFSEVWDDPELREYVAHEGSPDFVIHSDLLDYNKASEISNETYTLKPLHWRKNREAER